MTSLERGLALQQNRMLLSNRVSLILKTEKELLLQTIGDMAL